VTQGTPLTSQQPFVWPVRVYWEDTDAGGIVFYANYLKFMERARTEWLRALGVSQSALRETTASQAGGMFVVTDTQLQYKLPAQLDDQLLVTAQIIEKSRITLTIRQEIRREIRPESKQNMLTQLSNIEQSGSAMLLPTAELNALPLVCHGQIRIAWVSSDALKPTKIPQHVMEVLQ
jgi:acyl-CoA thioester hydrolase